MLGLRSTGVEATGHPLGFGTIYTPDNAQGGITAPISETGK